MVNWGELVIAAAVVVEKFERRIAVGANKDRRRPRMSTNNILFVAVAWWFAAAASGHGPRRGRLVPTFDDGGAHRSPNTY